MFSLMSKSHSYLFNEIVLNLTLYANVILNVDISFSLPHVQLSIIHCTKTMFSLIDHYIPQLSFLTRFNWDSKVDLKVHYDTDTVMNYLLHFFYDQDCYFYIDDTWVKHLFGNPQLWRLQLRFFGWQVYHWNCSTYPHSLFQLPVHWKHASFNLAACF